MDIPIFPGQAGGIYPPYYPPVPSDYELRERALHLATSNNPGSSPEYIVDIARQYFKFLKGEGN